MGGTRRSLRLQRAHYDEHPSADRPTTAAVESDGVSAMEEARSSYKRPHDLDDATSDVEDPEAKRVRIAFLERIDKSRATTPGPNDECCMMCEDPYDQEDSNDTDLETEPTTATTTGVLSGFLRWLGYSEKAEGQITVV